MPKGDISTGSTHYDTATTRTHRFPVGTDSDRFPRQRAAGWPVEGPPGDGQRHALGSRDRGRVAGSARPLRAVADRLRPLPPLDPLRLLGPPPGTLAGP